MVPVIALVGRPNVGKSTLFNKLTRTMDALVADMPGLTRDRKYGDGKLGGFPYTVVDTGGLSGTEAGIDAHMAKQTLQAIEEADAVLFMVDAREGLTHTDTEIAASLRRLESPVFLVVNKIDGIGEDQASAEFFALGLGQPVTIAAAHSRGLSKMLAQVADALQLEDVEDDAADEPDDRIRVGVIGRPNVGKSTLINRLIGEQRVVAFDQPGTTRDVVSVPFDRGRRGYTLLDTAGVRRRGRVSEAVEKFSVIKTLQAVEGSHVCLFMVDAVEGITDQDLNLMAYIIDKGRSLILVVNKWDELSSGERDHVKTELKRRAAFLQFTKSHYISALRGSGVDQLFSSINRAYESAKVNLSTPVLTRMLEHAVQEHQPPIVNGRRIKLRYAHQGGVNPPIVVIHGNQVDKVPGAYKRYLSNYFQQALGLFATPVRLSFSVKENPYENRHARRLTPLQKHKQEKARARGQGASARRRR